MEKDKPFRMQFLRDIAAECPTCMMCQKANDGTIVGAHSNAIADGHGTGQKAHDLLAYVCHECHTLIDSDWRHYKEDFYRAVYRSTVWLLEIGALQRGTYALRKR